MSKVKSAIFIAFYTLLIAVLGFICFVSFPYGENNVNKFNSILSVTQKDFDLGGYYGEGEDENYFLGGGYSGIYYPEGVVSAKEYEETLEGYEALVASYKDKIAATAEGPEKAELEKKLEDAEETLSDYSANYVAYGKALYLFKGNDEKDGIVGEDNLPTEEFKTAFKNTVDLIVERYARLHQGGVRVEVQDEYAIRIVVPQEMDSEQTALVYFGYTGAFTVKFGTSEDSAVTILPVRSTDKITDYIKGVSAVTRNGSSYIHIAFTKEGKEIIKNRTNEPASGSTLYFYVGDNAVISLTVESQITDDLYISSSQGYTQEVANTVATVLDTSFKGTEDDLVLNFGGTYRLGAGYGNNALMLLYIAFGVMTLGIFVFFFVRYHLLGFVHLYTYLLFTIATVLCVWSIPFLTINVATFTAFMFMTAILSVSNAVTFEYARKEYALGKTMASSVKTGYKKCFWHLFDLHIALALIGFVGFGIALASLSQFLFLIGLLAVFSGVGSLAINRFTWATLMSLTKNKRAFCNFKVEEVEDDE